MNFHERKGQYRDHSKEGCCSVVVLQDLRLSGGWVLIHQSHCVVSLSMTFYPQLSTGST